MTRTVRVARFQLTPWPVTLGWPWGILALVFLINLAIFGVLDRAGQGGGQPGGLVAIYIVLFISYLQAMNQIFSFALGFSVTRHRFYAATSLLAVAQSLVYGVVLYLFKLLESATGGWGVSMRFFGLTFLVQDNTLLQVLVYVMPFLVAAFLGVLLGIVFKRWGTNGLLTSGAGSIVVFGGLAVLVTWTGQWSAIYSWLADQSAAALIAGWPALLTAVLAAAGFLVIRRATP